MIDLLRARRSIRRYSDEPLDRTTVDLLIEALLRSPSSGLTMPCPMVYSTQQKRNA